MKEQRPTLMLCHMTDKGFDYGYIAMDIVGWVSHEGIQYPICKSRRRTFAVYDYPTGRKIADITMKDAQRKFDHMIEHDDICLYALPMKTVNKGEIK